jgi:hypothetical protein
MERTGWERNGMDGKGIKKLNGVETNAKNKS